MRHCALLLAFLVASLSLTEAALACSCAPSPPPKEALAEAHAVFSGKVTDVTVKDGRKFVSIEVDRVWKGDVPTKLVITTPQNGAACGYGFTTAGDATYLVYAYRTDGGLGPTYAREPARWRTPTRI